MVNSFRFSLLDLFYCNSYLLSYAIGRYIYSQQVNEEFNNQVKLEKRGKTEHINQEFLEETHLKYEILDNWFSIEAIIDEDKVENEQDLTVNLEENQQEHQQE